MSAFPDHVRHGLRALRRSPGFAATIVSTLAAGVAAVTVIVAIVNAVLWAKYDRYRDPGRLVYILESNVQRGANGGVSPRTLGDWKASARSFERIGGVEPGPATLVSAGSLPESVMRAAVTADLLAVLDGRPAAGRLFEPPEYESPAARVALLTHRVWRDRFRADPAAVGGSLEIDGAPFTIVGVLEPAFALSPFLGAEPDLYVPKAMTPGADRSARSLLVVGRLKPGASGAGAQAELDAISAAIAAADVLGQGWTPWLIQPRAFSTSGDSQFLVVLAVGVLLVLSIVCANVATLLLAHSAGRAREMATRLALGASRARLAGQLLTESLLLGSAAGLLGIALAWVACRLVTLSIAGSSLEHLEVAVDQRVLVAACVVSLLVALGVGTLPAWRLSRLPVSAALKDAGSLWGRLSAGRLRRLMVGGEVALAIVLLLSAGLVLVGLGNLRRTDPGFRAEGLITLRTALSPGRYPSAGARGRFVQEALDRLGSRRTFRSVAASSLMPGIGSEAPVEAIVLEGRRPDGDGPLPSASLLSVSPGYFATMGTPLVRGRGFLDAHGAEGLPAAVVSQRFVERWMAGADPIGARLQVEGTWRTVVGVAADVRTFHLNVAPRPTVYVPYAQRPVPSFWLLVRTAGSRDQAALAAECRREIAALDPDQPVRGGEWAASLMERSMGGFDLTGQFVTVLAALAAGLAALGIYGMVAFSVARRTREMGVRIAIGAEPRRLVCQVVGEALTLACGGAVPGLLLGLAAGQLLSSKLPQVSPFDPALLAAVCLLVLATVVAAAWGPARRAARVDPVTATRTE